MESREPKTLTPERFRRSRHAKLTLPGFPEGIHLASCDVGWRQRFARTAGELSTEPYACQRGDLRRLFQSFAGGFALLVRGQPALELCPRRRAVGSGLRRCQPMDHRLDEQQGNKSPGQRRSQSGQLRGGFGSCWNRVRWSERLDSELWRRYRCEASRERRPAAGNLQRRSNSRGGGV